MLIEIQQDVFNTLSEFKLGINHYTKITVSDSPQMLKGRLQLFQEQLFFELEEKPLSSYDEISEWRKVWKAFGADPNRYRPSAEALLRRIKKQNYMTTCNSAVDLNTFFSLQYKIPVGIYDISKISGDVKIMRGSENEAYEGLNGRLNTLKDILLVTDESNPFGSPFVDSKRTAVSGSTHEALQIFYICPSMNSTEAAKLSNSCGKMFTSLSGGTVQTFVLDKEQPSFTF